MARSRTVDPPSDELPFEAALERLEALVGELEAGDLELERALSAFEEGVALTRSCEARLEAAERRIEILTGEGSAAEPRPFDAPDGEESG